MQFVLHYRGRLRANGGPSEKQQLRLHFHQQLNSLWGTPPLSEVQLDATNPNPPDPDRGKENENLARLARMNQFPSLVQQVADQSFVPLVCQALAGVAHLDIALLRPEVPGNIVTQGGDIDNRIKTLLDALKIPDINQVKALGSEAAPPNPTFCVLEDDNLVTKLSVSTKRFLEPRVDPSEVVLLIEVTTQRTRQTMHNHVIA
jgi:Holliday junction resolvase RusA-like endonuclease